jgi:hypothetical protein
VVGRINPEQLNYDISSRIAPFGSRGMKAKESGEVDIYPRSGHTLVHIKKVFKGQLKYRTVRLHDGNWYESCMWFNTCEIVKTPRESWCDEALYEGASADGQWATFQHGPVSAPEREYALSCGGMRGWAENEWKNLPIGVQVK